MILKFSLPLFRISFAIFFLSLISFQAQSQVFGTVTDTKGASLPFVNIYIDGTSIGTTSNGDGIYELEVASVHEKVTLVYQFLGFTTMRREVVLAQLPLELNIQLTEETTSLDAVVVEAGINPANRIIRATIDRRKENLEMLSEFKARFYSRGLWKVKDAPEKILGQDMGDLGGGLDSTRTGIIYLSETISNIAYQRPDNFSEVIVASKVSGNDNGFSFNTASDANFSFYENTLGINTQIISPIANNAFSYYNYTLEGTFYEDGSLINKINVTPKRPKDRVFQGVIYIVEDDWQLYGVDLKTTGAAIQVPMIESLNFRQNFKKESALNVWVKATQVIDFSFAFLGLKGDGRFTAAYSAYDFEPAFDKESFSNEILSFEEAANEKDSVYWERARPVPLTALEVDDYIRKDSIQVLRKSRKYLDSIDSKGNRFKITTPIFGYTYKNTFKRWQLRFLPPAQHIQFNTVQGWNGELSATFASWSDEDFTKVFNAFAKANYGFSEDKLRYIFGLSRRFNRTNRASVGVSGGVYILQINNANPIRPIINSIYTLAQEQNFGKYYEKVFSQISYSQELLNGLRGTATMAYEERKALFNTTDQTFFPRGDRTYTSNNPLLPEQDGSAPFAAHTIGKLQLSTTLNIGQKYYSYPSGKFNVSSDKFPTMTVVYEKGFGASEAAYNFDQLRLILKQEFNVGNKGRLQYDARVGTFFGSAETISYVDRQHFNGNQTLFFEPTRLNRFQVLPYYERSTNQGYVEGHAEHNFKGWILGKVPLVNKLNFNLIAGAHVLSTEGARFYREFTIGIGNVGWGKYRILRMDYVLGQGAAGGRKGAFLIGLSL